MEPEEDPGSETEITIKIRSPSSSFISQGDNESGMTADGGDCGSLSVAVTIN